MFIFVCVCQDVLCLAIWMEAMWVVVSLHAGMERHGGAEDGKVLKSDIPHNDPKKRMSPLSHFSDEETEELARWVMAQSLEVSWKTGV